MRRGPFGCAALGYAERGLSPVPIQYRGKRALVKWRRLYQSGVSEGQAERWCRKFPNANVALLTGLPGRGYDGQRLVVLDVDSHAGRDVLKRHGMPRTATAQTGREGGRHYYMLTKTAVPTRRLADGVEMKCAGAYVLAPGSIHPNGTPYEWLRPLDAIADMPDDLLNLALERSHQDGTLRDGLRGVPEGMRKTEAVRIAGLLTREGFSDDGIRTFLLTWNEKNSPPWPDAEAQAQIDDILRSVAQWRQNPVSAPISPPVDVYQDLLHPLETVKTMGAYGWALLSVMASMEARYGRRFFASVRHLARLTGWSTATVWKHLKRLIETGFIEVVYRGNRIHAARYALIPDVIRRLKRSGGAIQ